MDLEYYLSESESSIIAIGRISKLLLNYFMSDLECIKETNEFKEIFALCRAIQMISYCMLLEHENAYKTIDKNYSSDYTYDEFMNEGIIL